MIRDLYFREETDSNYVEGVLETSNEIECLLNQVHMTLRTVKGDVLGAPNFGADLDDILFTTTSDLTSFTSTAKKQLDQYVSISDNYDISISPETYTNGYHDIAVLDVSINGHTLMGLPVGATMSNENNQ